MIFTRFAGECEPDGLRRKEVRVLRAVSRPVHLPVMVDQLRRLRSDASWTTVNQRTTSACARGTCQEEASEYANQLVDPMRDVRVCTRGARQAALGSALFRVRERFREVLSHQHWLRITCTLPAPAPNAPASPRSSSYCLASTAVSSSGSCMKLRRVPTSSTVFT